MESAYQPEAWHDVFLMIGTAAGALVGLLFIVMSLHLDKISALPDANMRITMQGARYNIMHLLTVVVETVALLAPQPVAALAVELIAINLFGLRLPFTIIRTYVGQQVTISGRGGFPTVLLATIIGAYLGGAAGGGLLLAGHPAWAMYIVTVSLLTKTVRSVLTAWMLMFAIRREEVGPQATERRRASAVSS
jgi:modulator of FtsH protease